MLLAYIDSIEPLVASAHAQMQMKQANSFFFFFFLEKICVGPCFFATVVVTPLIGNKQIKLNGINVWSRYVSHDTIPYIHQLYSFIFKYLEENKLKVFR